MVEYIPEYDYSKNGHQPLKKNFTEDLCGSCRSYYKMLFDKGLTTNPFPPQCNGHVLDSIRLLRPSDFANQEEYEETAILMDPITWAERELNWTHYWYQKNVSECTARMKILRGGRRCLAKGTLVATTLGNKNIEDIQVGDYVFDENNFPIKVKEVFDNGIQEVVDLVNYKREIFATCTLDHKWLGESWQSVASMELNTDSHMLVETRDLYSPREEGNASGYIRYVQDHRNSNGCRTQHVRPINKRLEHCYDIHVDSPTNLYCLANGLITHNSGKSRVELVLILHEMMTQGGRRVLLLCPSERLIGEFFDVINEFIASSTSLKNSVISNTKNPFILKLKNGSKLTGITISPNDPNAGDKARGFDAHMFVIDEAELFKEKDMEAIMALLVSNTDTRVMVSSTPKGWRKHFHKLCTIKDIGYKEFWWVSAESPKWTQQMEDSLKLQFSPAAYEQEFLADWGELEEGVFKKKFIEAAMQTYDMSIIKPERGRKYILGIDWNKSAGNHMCIIDYTDGNVKMVKKIVTPESEYMQTASVQDVINLHQEWRFKHIFLDKGYGHVQFELLQKWALANPASGMLTALEAISMNQSIELLNPINGEPIKLQAKAFIVNQTARLLEDGKIIIPRSEDYGNTANKAEGGNLHNIGLIEQMRNYKIEAYSIHNMPRFSQGEEHTLTAFMLACGGYVWRETGLVRMDYSSRVIGVATNTEQKPEISPTDKERIDDLNKGLRLTQSSVRVGKPKLSPSIRDLDSKMSKLTGKTFKSRGGEFKRKSF